MRQPSIRFESSPNYKFWGQQHSSRRRAGLAILLLLATCAAAWSAQSIWHTQQQVSLLRQEEASRQADVERALEAQRLALDLSSRLGVELTPENRRGLNRVIRQLNTPWPLVFEQIERSTPPDVAIIRMEPDGRGVLTIEVESVSLDKLVAYAGSLANQGIFGAMTYGRYEINEQDANRPARLAFQLALGSNP